jgi:hypothetical protein
VVLMSRPPFVLRVKIGEMEVELGGIKDEVISTLDDLDGIVEKVSDAFNLREKRKAQKAESPKAQSQTLMFPRIARTTQCGEAVVSLLTTEWGRTPRTISELREAMEANAIFFPKTTLSGVLVWLVKKGKIRRWKDKRRGYLYVLSEEGG